MRNGSFADAVLPHLKDFQRTTVEHAYRRLYGTDDPTTRFLVADEVGLGKTMVARGIIAKVLDELTHRVKRVDIIYVCSNSAIARQNINKLSVHKAGEVVLSSRITLLPLQTRHLKN